MSNAPKTVLAIHDLPGFGRAALSVIVPVLSCLGVQAVALPTAVLSTHTGGLGTPAKLSNPGYGPAALAHYQRLGLRFDCIYSGYLADPTQAKLVEQAFELWPRALKVVDPVLGDGGRLYKGLGADMVPAMYNLCSKANLIVPNVTEAALLLGESVTLTRGIGVVLIAAGTFLMIEKKGGVQKEESGWMLAAFGSAIFAALTSILGKVGITGVESNLGTALRTGVVLIMAWVMVFVQGKQGQVMAVPKNELGFICLSGLATGASWLCYYKALQLGPASLVAPIDKLSILVTVLFSYIVFHERLSRKALTGLAVLVAGTLVMLV